MMCLIEKIDPPVLTDACFEKIPQSAFMRFARRMRVSDSTALRKRVLKQAQDDANDEAYLLELLSQSSNNSAKPSRKRESDSENESLPKKCRQG